MGPLSRQQWLVDQLNLVRTEPENNLTKTGTLIPVIGHNGHIIEIIASACSCDPGSAGAISLYAGREP